MNRSSLSYALLIACVSLAMAPHAHAQCSTLLAEQGVKQTLNGGRYFYWVRLATKGRNPVDFHVQRVGSFPGDVGGNLPQLMRSSDTAYKEFMAGNGKTDMTGKIQVAFDRASGSGPTVLITNCKEVKAEHGGGGGGAVM